MANCNLVVESCKKLNLSLVGVGGLDLVDGNPKLTLVWKKMCVYLSLYRSMLFSDVFFFIFT